jgi:hypothetical protein
MLPDAKPLGRFSGWGLNPRKGEEAIPNLPLATTFAFQSGERSEYNSVFYFILTANSNRPFLKVLLIFLCWLKEIFEQAFIFWYKFGEIFFQEFVVKCLAVCRSISK